MLGRDGHQLAALRAVSIVPLIAQLSASVAPAGEGKAPAGQADRLLDLLPRNLDGRGASWPQREGVCGLANFSSIQGRIAAATSGATGVVA